MTEDAQKPTNAPQDNQAKTKTSVTADTTNWYYDAVGISGVEVNDTEVILTLEFNTFMQGRGQMIKVTREDLYFRPQHVIEQLVKKGWRYNLLENGGMRAISQLAAFVIPADAIREALQRNEERKANKAEVQKNVQLKTKARRVN